MVTPLRGRFTVNVAEEARMEAHEYRIGASGCDTRGVEVQPDKMTF